MKQGTFVMVDSAEFTNHLTKIDAIECALKKLNSFLAQQGKNNPTGEEKKRLVSPKQLAEELGKSEATVYAWRAKGIIKAYKISRSTYFDLNDVLEVIKS